MAEKDSRGHRQALAHYPPSVNQGARSLHEEQVVRSRLVVCLRMTRLAVRLSRGKEVIDPDYRTSV